MSWSDLQLNPEMVALEKNTTATALLEEDAIRLLKENKEL